VLPPARLLFLLLWQRSFLQFLAMLLGLKDHGSPLDTPYRLAVLNWISPPFWPWELDPTELNPEFLSSRKV